LKTLASRGVNALWLIGIGRGAARRRRSSAYAEIQTPVASAYSLASYEIAADLGESMLTATCAIVRLHMESGWRAIWCQTIWASTRTG